MAEQQSTPQPGQPRDLFARLANQTREVAYVLLGIGLIALGGTLYLALRFGSDRLLFTIWAGSLAAIFLGFGLYTLVRVSQAPGVVSADTWLRLLTALVGGLVGFVTALLGLLLPFNQPYKTVFAAGLTEWRQHPWYLVLVGGTLFGGLALMFVSLQLTRQFERSRAELRRLVYGFNAVLGVLLLFLVLGLVNVLGYSNVEPFTFLGKTTDWTASGIYTLKPSSVSILQSLDRPVKLYILMNTRAAGSREVLSEIETLLENVRRVNDKITYEVISPHLEPRRVQELIADYDYSPEAPSGILVVYGDEARAPSQFIEQNKLFRESEGGGLTFLGEGALMRALDFLKSGKSKARIYVTQGHGEPTLQGRGASSLGMLIGNLSNANSEFLPLDLRGAEPKVPDDATVVVVAGPLQTLSLTAVEALTHYYRGDQTPGAKKGKLFVMLDPVIQGGKMLDTGLEGLLREQGVQVNVDRVLIPNDAIPTSLLATGDPESNTRLAQALSRDFYFLKDARSVSKLPAPEGARGPARGHAPHPGHGTDLVREPAGRPDYAGAGTSQEPGGFHKSGPGTSRLHPGRHGFRREYPPHGGHG